MKKGSVGAACALLVIGLCLAYANHFQNSFHFDDAHTIQNNAAIREVRNIPLFFRDATTFSSLPTNQSTGRSSPPCSHWITISAMD